MNAREGPVFTVSELAARARALLEERFCPVQVVGEVSDPSLASSGHLYFSLKDEKAALPAVMFRSALARLGGSVPADGLKVTCLGRLTLYEPRGRTQLVVEWMVPCGAGALGLRFLALKHKLEAAGLFDPARKRPLPFLPGRIGVVTSPTGAAIRDILKVLARRFPSIPVLICPVRVQGEGAPGEIADAVRRMGDGLHCDVLIVGRGGGSAEDLWAFNEEVVVRAIVDSRVPVVSAVGHEVDIVLSDLAADVRAPTPSAAAEMVVPERNQLVRLLQRRIDDLRRIVRLLLVRRRGDFSQCTRRVRDPRLLLVAHRLRLDDLRNTAVQRFARRLSEDRGRMAEARVRLAARDPASVVLLGRNRLGGAAERIQQATRARLAALLGRLDGRKNRLLGLSPLSVLERGYSVVTRVDGTVVREAGQVQPGDGLQVRLARGGLEGIVRKILPG